MNSTKHTFRDPGPEWRGAPFWSWNDDLDPAELRRQVRAMKRAGLGGFFMHSRAGLVTPFLSERWMECVAAAVEEAGRQGMQAWLYDEDRWPSGAGGGLVPARHPEFAARYLELTEGRGDYRFAVRTENGAVVSYRRLKKGARPRRGERVQCFKIGAAPPCPWFNGGPYADNMNPDSVRGFIDTCYRPYAEHFVEHFGKTIPGIFTDEPNVFSLRGLPPAPRLPWTPRLPAEFKRRRGYDLMARLPELFSAHPAFARTRHDYWRTVTELFSEAYCGQIARWCERHGLELTGHMLCEQEFENEIPVGGAAMPSLAHMHRPGIDILREQTDEVLTCKQASSIAHQLGRPRTLSETYGTSGWQFTFEAQKWSGDWQTVLGINTRCQHLTPYSIRGMRKRDFPPTFSWHQPWWKYFRTVEDYFARATFFSTIGRPLRDILVLHNISSAWAGPPTAQDRRNKGEALRRVAEDLLALHYDFDLGDEIVMSRHGRVQGRRLLIGEAGYKLVVVPECDTIFRSTADLLHRFLRAGGRALCLGRRPTMIEGKPAPELETLFAHPNVTIIAAKRDELEDALRALLPRRVSITGEAGREVSDIIYQARSHRGRTYVMLANRDREGGHDVTVELPGEGRVEQWDLETGGTRALAARAAGGKTAVALHLPPTGSAALVLDPKRRPPARAPRRPTVVKVIALPDRWTPRRSTENSLPLDSCRWRFAGGSWSSEMPVFLAQRQLRAAMGLPDISHPDIPQPWAAYARPRRARPRAVELRFTFRVDEPPASGIDLVLESAELFDIFVNGAPVSNRARGWWLDKSMDRIPLSGVRRGENEIVLRCEYRDAPEYELEECYLIGDFAVDRATDAICRERNTIAPGDWCEQGYPYYAGNLYYGSEILLRIGRGQRAVLAVGPHFGACVAAHVNGKLAGVRGWAPYEVDITRRVKPGRNHIEIEVCGSPRNLLGPNHLDEKRPGWTGPNEFIRLDRWVEKRNLVPYGLMGDCVVRIEENAG